MLLFLLFLENTDLCPFLHSHYRNFIGSNTTFQHQFNGLYYSSVYSHMREPDTFPRSTNSIFTYTLRCLSLVLAACMYPPDFRHSYIMVFHNKNSYSTTLPMLKHQHTFLYVLHIVPLIRWFVSSLCEFEHSHHRYFIDPRHIIIHAFYSHLFGQVGSNHFCTNLTLMISSV